MTDLEVTQWIGYREPSDEQLQRCIAIRSRAADLARAIAANTPQGAEQTYCLHKVREALQAALTAVISPMPPNPSPQLD